MLKSFMKLYWLEFSNCSIGWKILFKNGRKQMNILFWHFLNKQYHIYKALVPIENFQKYFKWINIQDCMYFLKKKTVIWSHYSWTLLFAQKLIYIVRFPLTCLSKLFQWKNHYYNKTKEYLPQLITVSSSYSSHLKYSWPCWLMCQNPCLMLQEVPSVSEEGKPCRINCFPVTLVPQNID